MPTCIFCKRATSGHEPWEHILPESLCGQNSIVLARGEVCASCNNRLSAVENDLVRALRPLLAFTRVRRKKGGWHECNLDGVHVQGSNRGPLVLVREGTDSSALLRRTVRLRGGPSLSRGLFKIALEMTCDNVGADAVLHHRLDDLRDYVLKGRGTYWPVLARAQRTVNLLHIGSGHGTAHMWEGTSRVYHIEVILCSIVFHLVIGETPDQVTEYGRRENERMGRPAWSLLDKGGIARAP